MAIGALQSHEVTTKHEKQNYFQKSPAQVLYPTK